MSKLDKVTTTCRRGCTQLKIYMKYALYGTTAKSTVTNKKKQNLARVYCNGIWD